MDKELANTPAKQTYGIYFPKVNERVLWSGGILWSNQRVEDSDADEVPKGVPDDEESTYDD